MTSYTLCAIEAADPAPHPRPVRWWLDRLERWQAHEPDFMTLRQVAGVTRKEVAALCGVKEATVRQWEAGGKSPPRAIVLLLHLSGGQLGVLDPAWKDWVVRAGKLWAPDLLGRGFTPDNLKVASYAFKERDQLRRDLDRLTAQRSDEALEDHKRSPVSVRPVSLHRPRKPEPDASDDAQTTTRSPTNPPEQQQQGTTDPVAPRPHVARRANEP